MTIFVFFQFNNRFATLYVYRIEAIKVFRIPVQIKKLHYALLSTSIPLLALYIIINNYENSNLVYKNDYISSSISIN